MTAHSELFVDELVRDRARALLQNMGYDVRDYGLSIPDIPSRWRGLWGDNEFPADGEAEIYLVDASGNQTLIGIVDWETRFDIVRYHDGRSIEADVGDIGITLDPSFEKRWSNRMKKQGRMYKAKGIGSGWRGESHRHAMAARGIKTR